MPLVSESERQKALQRSITVAAPAGSTGTGGPQQAASVTPSLQRHVTMPMRLLHGTPSAVLQPLPEDFVLPPVPSSAKLHAGRSDDNIEQQGGAPSCTLSDSSLSAPACEGVSADKPEQRQQFGWLQHVPATPLRPLLAFCAAFVAYMGLQLPRSGAGK